MKLLVVGAAGAVGQSLVAEALDKGHEVTTFSTSLGPTAAVGSRMRALFGDMRDQCLVAAALTGREAVLWAAGSLLFPRETDLVWNMTAEMERQGPRRLVFLSALSAAESRRRATLFSAMFLVRLFRGPGELDVETQERYVRDRKLDWKIIRPGVLVDGPRKGSYRVGFGAADVADNPRISYADAAGFMLRQLTETVYLRTTVDLFY